MRVTEYCGCGAVLRGTYPVQDDAQVQECVRVWRSYHTDPECGPADARVAALARARDARRLEREALAERRREKGR